MRDVTFQENHDVLKDMRLEEASDRFVDYYVSQARQQRGSGDATTYFSGSRYQRGHGIGSIFAKIRAALPSFIKKIGVHALKTGLDVADDMLSGRKFKDVIGPRAYDGIKRASRDVFLQSGSGSRKRCCCRDKQKRIAKRRRSEDIFDD